MGVSYTVYLDVSRIQTGMHIIDSMKQWELSPCGIPRHACRFTRKSRRFTHP